MSIKLYDSLTQKIKPLVPRTDNHVKIYCCGITPYDASHLGHASVFLFFDTLIRFINYSGYKTTCVQNITDVDDDMLKKVRETGKNWQELGEHWVNVLLKDFDFLHMKRPDFMPKASQVIPDIIKINEVLQKKGLAYEVNGTLYFSIKNYKNYGQLSRLPHSDMLTISAERGNNIEDIQKKDPLDFVLWQLSKPNEPSWESPWGVGRPGWHIECSAMSMRYLGEQIDIHGGGIDLIFPHHESEIAQSESYTGCSPFVSHWLHSAMVYYKGKKMSKSLGNLVFVSDLAKKYSANAIRWLLLSHHYRAEWEYVEEELSNAQKTVNRIEKNLTSYVLPLTTNQTSSRRVEPSGRRLPSSFLDALSYDFDTPSALEIIKQSKNQEETAAMWRILGFN